MNRQDVTDFLRGMLVFVGWFLFFAMIAGIILFGIMAREQAQVCASAYERYIADKNYTCESRATCTGLSGNAQNILPANITPNARKQP